LTNSPAAAGYQPPVGSGNVTGPGSSTTGHIATFADATGRVLSDGGAPVGAANTITPSMLANAAVAFGVGMLNGTLVASVAGSALTIAVKTLAGGNPSSSDPVFFLFRDASTGYAVIEQTAALSITVPSGATLGTVNGQANRIWVGVFNNGGAAVLGVYNSLSGTNILCWDETSPANGTGVTASSTSSQIWYTASTLSSAVFRILGYVESTQATAGTWATSPSKMQLFGPGVKRPGDTVQETTSNNISTSATTTSTTYVALTGQNVTISVQSAVNVTRAEAFVTQAVPGATNQTFSPFMRMSRGTVANANLIGSENTPQVSINNAVTLQLNLVDSMLAYDIPNTTGNVTYAVQGKINSGTLTVNPGSLIAAREIQV
jgi:hypothetical protein